MSIYLDKLADRIKAEVPNDALPAGDTRLLFLLYAVLARSKGQSVTGSDVHDAWVAWMSEQGKKHESMVPFAELPAEIQAEDGPFAAAIRRVAALSG